MQSKKKTKKTSAKKTVKAKTVLVAQPQLVAKLKKSGLHKTVIARHCGYSSHNTVTNWFKSKKVPQNLVAKLTKLATKSAGV